MGTKKITLKVGDVGLITGHYRIHPDKYNEMYPQGNFGKIIELRQRYSHFNGYKLPLVVVVRCKIRHWNKKRKSEHRETTVEFFKPIKIK